MNDADGERALKNHKHLCELLLQEACVLGMDLGALVSSLTCLIGTILMKTEDPPSSFDQFVKAVISMREETKKFFPDKFTKSSSPE